MGYNPWGHKESDTTEATEGIHTHVGIKNGSRMDKEDMVQIYNGIVLSLLFIQNKEIMPFAATRMDLVSVILSEVSQTKRNIV